MIQTQNITEIKNRFATIITKMYYGASIDLDNITDKVLYDNFFDCLEENDVFRLYDSTQEIIKKLFNAEIKFDSNNVNPVFWAAQQYINISLNCLIPLKQIMLLCPLKEMISHFTIYHEMNDIEIKKEFLSNENKRIILKELRKGRHLSIRELAVLTDISIDTIKYYEKNNEILFKASSENILKLARALNVSLSFFKKRSDFVVISEALLENEDYVKMLKESIQDYLGTKNDIAINKWTLNTVVVNNKLKVLSDDVLYSLIARTNSKYILENNFNVLIL